MTKRRLVLCIIHLVNLDDFENNKHINKINLTMFYLIIMCKSITDLTTIQYFSCLDTILGGAQQGSQLTTICLMYLMYCWEETDKEAIKLSISSMLDSDKNYGEKLSKAGR